MVSIGIGQVSSGFLDLLTRWLSGQSGINQESVQCRVVVVSSSSVQWSVGQSNSVDFLGLVVD